MIKVIVNGACGQMGSTIVQLLLENPKDFLLLAGVSKTNCAMTSYPLVHTISEAPSGAEWYSTFRTPAQFRRIGILQKERRASGDGHHRSE